MSIQTIVDACNLPSGNVTVTDRWAMLNGDCLNVLSAMPDDCVDICVTSPPYNWIANKGIEQSMLDRGIYSSATSKKYEQSYSDSVDEQTYQIHMRLILTQLLRISKGVVWVNHKLRFVGNRGIHPLHIFNSFPLACEVIWDRANSPFRHNRFAQCTEYIHAFGDFHYWDKSFSGVYNVFRVAAHIGKDKYSSEHTCPYPMDLIKPLIKASCPRNGIVLDPFAGSNTTGVVSLLTGRRAIGIEKERRFYKLSVERTKDYEQRIEKAREKSK